MKIRCPHCHGWIPDGLSEGTNPETVDAKRSGSASAAGPLAESDCTCRVRQVSPMKRDIDPNCPVHGDKGPKRLHELEIKPDKGPERIDCICGLAPRLQARAEAAEADRDKWFEVSVKEGNRRYAAEAKLEAVRDYSRELAKQGPPELFYTSAVGKELLSLLAQEESE